MRRKNVSYYRVLPDKFTLIACAVAVAILLVVLFTAR